MPKPVIAIVGRPNVGKSTLFNRLLRQRKTIVDKREGITRDRIYGEFDWNGRCFTVVDTGGYIPEDADIFNTAVREQAQQAIAEADLILFMVDGTVPPTSSDQVLAQSVRRSGKPAILVVNKCDTQPHDSRLLQFHELGLEPLLPISALSGRQTGDLLDAVLERLNLPAQAPSGVEDETIRLAIVGMPNVGKSSLANALLQNERSIVTPVAGTTRDAIDSTLKWYGHTFTLIDTAGLRRKSRVQDNVEFYSTVRARQAIASSQVVLVLIDATKGFDTQDRAIAREVIDQGRGLVLLVNKWDLISRTNTSVKEFTDRIRYGFKSLEHYPVLFISALTRQRVSRVLELSYRVYQAWNQKISTRELNDYLKVIVANNAPPASQGRVAKFKYLTQVHSGPPLFACFCNYPHLVPVTYKRYVENMMRKRFALEGVPIKVSYRQK